jgi:hypothetical protein
VAVRRHSDLTGAFAFIGYGVLAMVIAVAIGVFIYSQILATKQAAKDQELQQQIAAIDPQTVSKFTHLRDRLSHGLSLLNSHIALTGFWDVLTAIVPSSVRFASITLAKDETGLVTLQAAGISKSFNALAATSDAFAQDGLIKDAIFSGIRVEGNAVSFSLNATIDPSLVEFSAPVATTTVTDSSTTAPSSSVTTP